MKGSLISNDCVIAARSVVAKEFHDTKVLLADNPSTIVKTIVSWIDKCSRLYWASCLEAKIIKINGKDNTSVVYNSIGIY